MIMLNLFAITILMIVVPLMLGYIMMELARVRYSDLFSKIGFSYTMGHIVMWSVFQLIAVPLILLKSRLMVVTILWLVLILAYAIAGMVYIRKYGHTNRKIIAETKKPENKPWLIMSVILAVVVVGYQCYKYFFYMHIDDDDSRFIVNAVDAYEKGTMFLTNPANGNYEGAWVGELVKDVSSPWPIYLAMLGKMLGIYPTILAHTIYPVFLLTAGYVSYYLMGKFLFNDNRIKSFLMVAVVATINMSFGESTYNQSYFTIVRIWQGKAVVAGTLIPFLTFLLIRLYKEGGNKGSYVMLALANMAMCLMSGMGIFFSGILTGVCGLWFVVIKKHWRQLPYVIMACIPTIIYGLCYVMIK